MDKSDSSSQVVVWFRESGFSGVIGSTIHIVIYARVNTFPIIIVRNVMLLLIIIRESHHDWSHHFVILVVKEVTMINISWELNQLLFINMEIVTSINICIISSFSPPDSDNSCIS